jgi:hypothetical protein
MENIEAASPQDLARRALAVIRILNGAAGLVAPSFLSQRLGVADPAGGMAYPFRMFGIRTILIGSDLFARDPSVRRHALRAALVVHGSDTISAVVAGRTGALPKRAARRATIISAVNLALAVTANWNDIDSL